MPRGKPKAGFRRRKNKNGHYGITQYAEKRLAMLSEPNNVIALPLFAKPTHNESDHEISTRINKRFNILHSLAQSAVDGDAAAVIVSGPAGLGKSYTVEEVVADWDPKGTKHTTIKGYVRATGLFRTLYQYRHKNNVIVFDDADSIFNDETALNMLKAVCDSNDLRTVSYLAETTLEDENGEPIPRTFDFEGSIIFITNYDFDAMIEKNHKLTPHLQALMSRSHYIDLTMKTRRDYIVRIKQVIESGMLNQRGLDKKAEHDVVDFIERNADKMRELSLRSALKIATLRKRDLANWYEIADITMCWSHKR